MADRVGVDWDDTLVEARTQRWLPGAQMFLRGIIARGYQPFIHTCRANWPEGLASIEASLERERLRGIEVIPKPAAVLYVDNLGCRYHDGNYAEILRQIPPTRAALKQAGIH